MNDIEVLTRYSHEYTEETLKCKLCESLTKILSTSQEGTKQAEDGGQTFLYVATNASTHHFSDVFLRVALQKIDWRYICNQYDFYYVDQNSSSCVSPAKMKSTTLDVLLDCFENPTIWPIACLTSTFRVLLEVFYVDKVEYYDRTFSVKGNTEQVELTPSQTRILHFLTMVMQRNQCMQNISFWTAGHKIWVFNGISTSYHGDIALKLLRYWFLKLPYCRVVWISLLSHLMAVLDALEASLLKKLKDIEGASIAEEEKITTQHRQHDNCTSNYSRNRYILQSSFDFQNLHGEGMPVEICASDLPKSQSLHLLTSTSFRVIQDNWRLDNSIPQNLLELWKIKAASVDFLVCCARRLTFNWAVQKSIQFQADPLVTILHELLVTFSTNPNSATIRLSCILVVQACAAFRSCDYLHDGLDALLSLVWSQSISATDRCKAETFVQFYSELIIVCSRYDNQICLMKAITPLLMALNRTVEIQLRSGLTVKQSSAQVNHPTTFDYPLIIRKCFAKILSCRYSILFSPSPPTISITLLSSLITNLSLLYDEPDKWIDTSIGKCDRYLMIKALQKIGILGLHSEYSSCIEAKSVVDYTMPNTELKNNLQSLLPWVSEELKTILLNTFAKSGTLHSSIDCEEKKNDNMLTEGTYRSGSAINDFLQEDLIVQIFSYLNYKRLVRMRLVCRNWNNIADTQSLWYQNYNKRFKHPKEETENFLCNPTLFNWLEVFKTRHQRERAIRNRKSLKYPGWRIRLCNHFRCTSVLKSPDAMRKHNSKHTAKYV